MQRRKRKITKISLQQYPTPRGQRRKLGVKYGVGGLILFLLIFIIWFPLLLFSLADTVLYESNLPIDCTVDVKLGGYQPIFSMSAQQQFLATMSKYDYNRLQNVYSHNAVSSTLPKYFELIRKIPLRHLLPPWSAFDKAITEYHNLNTVHSLPVS